MFQATTVEYTGTRKVPARVFIYHNGTVYNAQGYIFGGGRNFAPMSQVEANILTGAEPPVIDEATGKVLTGFVIQMDLGKGGLTGETWRLVTPAAPPAHVEQPTSTGDETGLIN